MHSHQKLFDLGQTLKKNREGQGLSLEKISEWTNISVHILKAIEEAQADQLPVYTYLRGFILTYAKTIGMDEKEVEKDLKKLVSKGESAHLSGVAASSSEAENLIEKDLRLMPVILAISILFVLGSILVFTNVIRSYKEQPPQGEGFIEENTPQLQEAQMDEIDDKSAGSSVDEKEQKIRKEEQVSPGKEQKTNTNTQPTADKIDFPLEVVVKAIGGVRVSYQEDDKKRKEVHLKTDQFKVLNAQEKIFIETENSDLIYIFDRGKNLGLFGPGGKKEKLFYIE